MTKKEIIKKIRASFRDFRECTNGMVNRYFYVNGICFFLPFIKLVFNDNLEELIIYDGKKAVIMCTIEYSQIKSVGAHWCYN